MAVLIAVATGSLNVINFFGNILRAGEKSTRDATASFRSRLRFPDRENPDQQHRDNMGYLPRSHGATNRNLQ